MEVVVRREVPIHFLIWPRREDVRVRVGVEAFTIHSSMLPFRTFYSRFGCPGMDVRTEEVGWDLCP
jgi:hypothetical protein